MSEALVRTAVIVGSIREGRSGDTVVRWFIERAALHHEIDVDLAEANLPSVLRDTPPPEVEAATSRFAAADAFVFITPEHNRSYPASLKFSHRFGAGGMERQAGSLRVLWRDVRGAENSGTTPAGLRETAYGLAA